MKKEAAGQLIRNEISMMTLKRVYTDLYGILARFDDRSNKPNEKINKLLITTAKLMKEILIDDAVKSIILKMEIEKLLKLDDFKPKNIQEKK